MEYAIQQGFPLHIALSRMRSNCIPFFFTYNTVHQRVMSSKDTEYVIKLTYAELVSCLSGALPFRSNTNDDIPQHLPPSTSFFHCNPLYTIQNSPSQYNEEIKDLLATYPNENLRIIDDLQLGPIIQNITEAPFVSLADTKVAIIYCGFRRI